jgi:hypothetical protein
LKEGETKLNFVLFDPQLKRAKEYVEGKIRFISRSNISELFEMAVNEEMSIEELTNLLSAKLKEVCEVSCSKLNANY